MQRDKRLMAYVLRRTNYGEADRILNLITEEGKITAIAKSVRKEKSKLAGSVEMFSLIDMNLYFGKNGMAIVTGAKMMKFYGNLLKELPRMELATMMLKKISIAAESTDTSEYFVILDAALRVLNAGAEAGIVEAWFLLNLARVMGEQVNVYRDTDGEKLAENVRYSWDKMEKALVKNASGEIDADAIKIIRLMLTTKLDVAMRVKGISEKVPVILDIARCVVS